MRHTTRQIFFKCFAALLALACWLGASLGPSPALAQQGAGGAATSIAKTLPPPSPSIMGTSGVKIEVGAPGQDGKGNLVPALKLTLILLALGLLPAAIISVTSFTRIVIVLGFVRQALGTQSLPPNQVILGLSLFLCLFTMAPTLGEVREVAVEPYMAGQMTDMEALEAGVQPMRKFMARHTRPEELRLFVGMTQNTKPKNFDEISTLVLIPSFMLSELRTAFIMGALIYLPFIIIDLVTASVLMAMGMMMVPPAMISLPIKLLLFVLVDGWNLVVGSLARSIMGGG